MILLARTLLRSPRVVLLDEPSAWLDEASEHHLVNALGPWLEGRTLIVATHRPAVLRWVDRIVVVDNGRVALDDTKQAVLEKLSQPAAPPTPTPAKPPTPTKPAGVTAAYATRTTSKQ